MTNIVFIIVIIAILFWLCEEHDEGFVTTRTAKHPLWYSSSYNYKCAGKKSALHKVFSSTYEDGLTMRNIQCIGDNKPATKCWVFDNSKNSMKCDEQVNGDCVKLLNNEIVCSDSPDQSFMFQCNGNMDDPECKRLYVSNKLEPSLSTQGFKCDYGNGTVPLQITDNIISGFMMKNSKGKTDGTKVLRAKTNADCVDMLKNSPFGEEKVTCSDGKTGERCIALFDTAGIQTWRGLGYDCLTIGGKQYIAKKHADNNGVDFASHDGVNTLDCDGKIDIPLKTTQKPIICNTATDANALCSVAFRDLNLQQPTNPTAPATNPPTAPATNPTITPPASNPVVTPPATNSGSSSSSSGLSTTTIIWIVVVVILIVLIAGAGIFYMSRGSSSNSGSGNENANVDDYGIEMGDMSGQNNQYALEEQYMPEQQYEQEQVGGQRSNQRFTRGYWR